MNHSVNSSSTLERPDVLYASSVVALLLVPHINIYALVLIIRGGVGTITSEFYCLNMTVSDTLMCFFCLFYILYIGKHLQVFLTVSQFFISFINISRPLFQGCICVERYLAVLHPVTFLRYKLLRYKIMCCSVVWLIVLAISVVFIDYGPIMIVLFNVLLGFYIVLFSLMLFCGVSVLWALKQPGPGEGKRQRAEGHDAKRRAFNIIMITTVVAVINYLPYVLILGLKDYMNPKDFGLYIGISLSFSILNGFVNPLFYLQRAAKLPSFCFDLQRFILIK